MKLFKASLLILFIGIITYSCGTESEPSSENENPDPQPSIETFNIVYGGSNTDRGNSIKRTTDGGFILIGTTESNSGDFSENNIGGIDIIVLKLDSSGQIEWDNIIGGRGSDFGFDIIQSSDGSYLLTGYTESNEVDFDGIENNQRRANLIVVKLDTSGQIEWIKSLGGFAPDQGVSIIETSNAEIIVVGITFSNDGDFENMNRGDSDIFVLNLNQSGNLNWLKTFGGSERDIGYSIAQHQASDNYVISGSTESNDGDFNNLNHGETDIFTLSLDQQGELNWIKTYGGSNGETGSSISQLSDGFIITGGSSSLDGDFTGLNKGSSDIFIMKINSNGDREWIKNYGGSNSEGGRIVYQTSDGGSIITGTSSSKDLDLNGLNNGDTDIFILKLDSSGNQEWVKNFGGSKRDHGHSVLETIDGGFVITGRTESNTDDFDGMNKGEFDIFLLKVDSNGNL